MGFVLLGHIESAESGNGSGSRLAVDCQAIRLLKSLDLAAGGTEVVPVLHIEACKAVRREELLQLADVLADAAVLQHAGEDVPALAVGDLRFRPEGRPAVDLDFHVLPVRGSFATPASRPFASITLSSVSTT